MQKLKPNRNHPSLTIATSNGLTAAELGLRFDKVALRVLEILRVHTEHSLNKGETVIVTVTAPIRVPARTAKDIATFVESLVSTSTDQANKKAQVQGNRVYLRLLKHGRPNAPRFIGFIHNPDVKASRLLRLATAWLTEQ